MLPGFTPSLHFYGGVYASGGSADWPEITCWTTICLNWIFKIFTNFSVFVFVFGIDEITHISGLDVYESLWFWCWRAERGDVTLLNWNSSYIKCEEIKVYLSCMTSFGSHAKPGRRQSKRRWSREEFFHCWRRRQASSKMFDCSRWNLSARHSLFCQRLSLSLFHA